MKNPRDIEAIIPGYKYKIPVYEIINDGIITWIEGTTIQFCRGDKADESKPRQEGLFVESLLEAIQHRLTTVNTGELATRETSVAITKIQEAIMWLEKRSNDRKIRNVEGTYQK